MTGSDGRCGRVHRCQLLLLLLLLLQYIADAGGAAAEEDYQYMGQNMFCG
jgi:hypothetical protein